MAAGRSGYNLVLAANLARRTRRRKRVLEKEPPGADTDSHAALASSYRLTPREEQVLDHMLAGHLNKQTAHRLMISTRTVEHYRAAVMLKMGGHNLADIIRIAALEQIGPQ